LSLLLLFNNGQYELQEGYEDSNYSIGIFGLSYEDNNILVTISVEDFSDYDFIIPIVIAGFDDYNFLIMNLDEDVVDGNYYIRCIADELEDANFIINIAGYHAAEDYASLIQACADGFEDYNFKINSFEDETIDGSTYVPIVATGHIDANIYITSLYEDFIDATYITRIYDEYAYENNLYEVYISDYCDTNFFIPIPDHLDYIISVTTADYKDCSFYLVIPNYIDANFFIPTPDYLDYQYSSFIADYNDTSIIIPITSTEYVDATYYLTTHQFVDYEFLVFVPYCEDFIVQVSMADYIDTNMYVSVLDEDTADASMAICIAEYLDVSISVSISDYVDASMFIPTPGYVDASMFIPTPGYKDYQFTTEIADYVDGNWYIPIRAVSFCEASAVFKYIALSYCDSGGIEEGIFINIETFFGFADAPTRIGVVTDNLLDVAHVLVSSEVGHGQQSPVMLIERGPYFGVTNTFRVIHYNWSRCIMRLYGYVDSITAYTAVDEHINNGAVQVKMLWEPIEVGQWYIVRWKDTVDGVFRYSYFRGVETANNYAATLVVDGKYEVEAHIWEATMPYFQVVTVQAAYLETSHNVFNARLELTNADIDAFNQLGGYIWETDVSDSDDETWWQTEDGAITPHWIRVIF